MTRIFYEAATLQGFQWYDPIGSTSSNLVSTQETPTQRYPNVEILEPTIPEVVVISSDSSTNPSYEFQFEVESSESSGYQNLSPVSQ
ncbi:unnamed protein product [Cochlearia groenlandica]